MKLLTFPIKLLFRLVLLPIRILFAATGLTFRAGFKAGTLPVKGGVAAGRALGLKALVLFAAGVAVGVVVGRRLGAFGAELAESGYPGAGTDGNGSGPAVGIATLTEDTLAVVDTPDGPKVELVEDTIEVVETAGGEVVTETVTVTELDADEVEAILEAEALAEAEEEMADEVEAEIDQALGFTAGELGVDVDEDA